MFLGEQTTLQIQQSDQGSQSQMQYCCPSVHHRCSVKTQKNFRNLLECCYQTALYYHLLTYLQINLQKRIPCSLTTPVPTCTCRYNSKDNLCFSGSTGCTKRGRSYIGTACAPKQKTRGWLGTVDGPKRL